MFNMKRQIVAGDDHHYNQNKMSRSTRAKTKMAQNCNDYLADNPNTFAIWLWLQRRNIKYWVFSLSAECSHSYASFGSYNQLLNQTTSAPLSFAVKVDLHVSYTHTQETSDFWQLFWDKY